MRTLPMTLTKSFLMVLTALAIGCGPGLAGPLDGDFPVDPEAESEAGLLDWNGLGVNGLGVNGLGVNGLGVNGLGVNGLGVNGLSTAAFNTWFNSTSFTLQATTMKYVARCALPSTKSLTYRDAKGTSYSWPGQFGLAPVWASGKLPAAGELQWVSACMLAHVNGSGSDGIVVSFRASTIATTRTEAQAYPFGEAAFWGNLFVTPQIRMVCDARRWATTGLTADPTTDIMYAGRSCGVSDKCGFTNVGGCRWAQCAYTTSATTGTVFTQCGTSRQVVTTYRNIDLVCGDGVCGAGETNLTCPHDCK